MTLTPVSVTVPQLVTVASTARREVGGTIVGEVPAVGASENGAVHESPTIPVPPVAIAGGVRPSALISSWWNGASAGDAERVEAASPRAVALSGDFASDEGTQTDGGRWIGSR